MDFFDHLEMAAATPGGVGGRGLCLFWECLLSAGIPLIPNTLNLGLLPWRWAAYGNQVGVIVENICWDLSSNWLLIRSGWRAGQWLIHGHDANKCKSEGVIEAENILTCVSLFKAEIFRLAGVQEAMSPHSDRQN